MATQRGNVSFKLLDANNARGSTNMQLTIDDTKTIAELLGDIQDMSLLVDGVTGAYIEGVTVSIDYNPVGTKGDPSPDIDLNQTMTMNFRQTGNPYSQGIVIPGVADFLVVGGKIDLTATQVTDLVTFIETAQTAIRVVGRAFSALYDLLDALLSFRKLRRASSRRSYPA